MQISFRRNDLIDYKGEFMDITLFYEIPGLIVFGYFLGSIPWGLVFTRTFTSVDITAQGSGNIGASNVKRLTGLRWGMLTLIGDVSKGLIPVYLARNLLGMETSFAQISVFLVALAAFLGHLFPVYLKFKKGGKGVATMFGCFMVISFWACLVSFLIYVVMVYFSRRSSVGSLCASAILPFAVWIISGLPLFAAFTAIFSAMIFWRHKANIKRLVNGTEPKIM